MSHTVTIKCSMTDHRALQAACARLKLEMPKIGVHELFSESISGAAVLLPGWRYPVVVGTNGDVKSDNYGGQWGKDAELNKLLQAYAVEKARLEARKQGHSVSEQTLPDGSVKLIVGVGE